MNVVAHRSDYIHHNPNRSSDYIMPVVLRELRRTGARRVLDLGCGTGDPAALMAARGMEVLGVDPSRDGITKARRKFPHIRFELGSTEADLASLYGQWPAVVSIEVIEHIYDPRKFAKSLYDAVEDGGSAIVTTPYHGYVKNVLIAALGKSDQHFMPLRSHGHIKFWSIATLRTLLLEAGFSSVEFKFAGRISLLAKSMVAIARKG